MRTYSVAELQDLSGFDRRTIVYYIQQGLVRRPGRRGPNTRYPQDALVRLQFIRGVKDLQTHGQLLNVTLTDIRRVLEAVGPEQAQVLVSRSMPPEDIEPLFAEPPQEPAAPSAPEPAVAAPAAGQSAPPRERRAFGLADAGVRQRFMVAKQQVSPESASPAARDLAAPPAIVSTFRSAGPSERSVPTAQPAEPVDLAGLGDMLRELEIRPSMTGKRLAPGASEQWTEIPITSRVYLSVRGLSADDAPLADAVGRAMKRLLRVR
jgi:DNA-binding transcriptional MerR regulator